MTTLAAIVENVNRGARERPIGQLQELRKRLRGLQRKPRRDVFGPPHNENWTFHAGGRDELQFNLAFEEPFDEGDFRFGVAFSFELSQSLPTLDPLERRLLLFNDYLREHLETLADLYMWHHADGKRSLLRSPTLISAELFRPDVFVFLGGIGWRSAPDYELVLDIFDRLLPIWRFIEEHINGNEPQPDPGAFSLKPGLLRRARRTTANQAARALEIDLRHNVLQSMLYDQLVEEHGFKNVAAEHRAPRGGLIDLLVITPDRCAVYEIKTAATARGCVREAMGQLLEYGCWPDGLEATELCVVGEPELDASTAAYLDALNRQFPVRLAYRQVKMASK